MNIVLPAQARLIQRSVLDEGYCRMCFMAVEDETHLFMRCSLARRVWSLFNSNMNLSDDMDVVNLICCWLKNGPNDFLRQVCCIFWSLWNA